MANTRAQVLYMVKPGTAGAAAQPVRHSMPALLPCAQHHSSGGSMSRSPSSKQRRSLPAAQHRAAAPGYGGAPLPQLGLLGPTAGSHTCNSGSASRQQQRPSSTSTQPHAHAAAAAGGGVAGLSPPPRHSAAAAARGGLGLLAGVGSGSIGPSTGAQLYPSSLRQELYHPGASGLQGAFASGGGCEDSRAPADTCVCGAAAARRPRLGRCAVHVTRRQALLGVQHQGWRGTR
jgi:hypothetical protein